MSSDAHCPFCNAVLPPLSAPPTLPRIPCPRCGEMVPATRWSVDLAAASLAGLPPKPVGPQVPGTRRTMLVLLGVMAAMACISLVYALSTVSVRREHDYKERPHAKRLDAIPLRAPLELSGLGWLPTGSQLVVGVHLAEIFDDQATKALLDEPRPVLLDTFLKQLPRTTGLPLEAFDHVLIATRFDKDFPQVTVIARTRRPYDQAKIAEKIQPTRTMKFRDRAAYEFALKPLGDALLWCADDKTLIYALRPEAPKLSHLADVPEKANEKLESLSPELKQVIAERVNKQSVLWLAADMDAFQPVLKEYGKLLPNPEQLTFLKSLKRVAVGVYSQEGITLNGHFQANSVEGSKSLQGLFNAAVFTGAKSQKVEGPPAGATQLDDLWVIWQIRAEVDSLRAALNAAKK